MVARPRPLDELLKLPADARAAAAAELLRSLDDEAEPGAADAWDEELDRRAAEVEAGTAATMTFDEYRAYLRDRRAARSTR